MIKRAVSDYELNYLIDQLLTKINNKIDITDNKVIRLDEYGKIPANILNGKIPIENIPHEAIERCVVVADESERLDLTKDKVQTGDTVKVVLTNKMYYVIDDRKLGTDEVEKAFEIYNSGSAGKLTTARNIALTGDVTGNAYFDGSSDININVVINSVSGPLVLNSDVYGEFFPTSNLTNGRIFFKKIPGTTVDTSVILLDESLYGDSLPETVGNENDMYFVKV